MTRLVTIVETAAYAADAKAHLTETRRLAVASMIAEDPACGDLMIGTGGCRKVRFALGGRGKSGSVRVVYVYCGETLPIFLLALFAKNEKSNLTQAEKNALAKLIRELKKTYSHKNKRSRKDRNT